MNKAKWYDIFTDSNGNPCAPKVAGWLLFIACGVLLFLNSNLALPGIGIAAGLLTAGKGLDAVIPKDPVQLANNQGA